MARLVSMFDSFQNFLPTFASQRKRRRCEWISMGTVWDKLKRNGSVKKQLFETGQSEPSDCLASSAFNLTSWHFGPQERSFLFDFNSREPQHRHRDTANRLSRILQAELPKLV
jgi:hypothetical protein